MRVLLLFDATLEARIRSYSLRVLQSSSETLQIKLVLWMLL